MIMLIPQVAASPLFKSEVSSRYRLHSRIEQDASDISALVKKANILFGSLSKQLHHSVPCFKVFLVGFLGFPFICVAICRARRIQPVEVQLKGLHVTGKPREAHTGVGCDLVQPGNPSFNKWNMNFLGFLKQEGSCGLARAESGLAHQVRLQQHANHPYRNACCRNLSRQIAKHNAFFSFLSSYGLSVCTLSVITSLPMRHARQGICLPAEPIHCSRCDGSDTNVNHPKAQRQVGEERGPCFPPYMALLAQRPTLADSFQHAHFRIPLWIWADSAMEAGRA